MRKPGRPRSPRPPDLCPNCGAAVPANARACPECGADEQTGWSAQAGAQRADIPDDEFDYNEFLQEEFGEENRTRPRGIHWFWWLVALGLVAGFVYWSFLGRLF
jgi:hypothetical protein